MSLYTIKELINEIEELQRDIEYGERAWNEGTDECAMAECDPSDQYCKGQEIDRLIVKLKAQVNAL